MHSASPHDTSSALQDPPKAQAWRELDCRLPGVQAVFEAALPPVLQRLTPAQLHGLWGVGRQLGKLGRGPAPVIAWITHWPAVVTTLGDETLNDVVALVLDMHRSPNSQAIAPLIQSLSTAATRLRSHEGVRQYLHLIAQFMQQTTGSIHGRQMTQPSAGLIPLLEQSPRLLQQVSLSGLRRWVEHGAHVHARHPLHQADYFALTSPDSVAMLQRQRHGTLFVDVQRTLSLTLQALCRTDLALAPLNTPQADANRQSPALQEDTLALPDVLEALGPIDGLTRYRLMLMHAAGHRAWSGPCIADNWSPAQRLAVEWLEDARIDRLLLQRWPGLRQPMLALLPPVEEGQCDEMQFACLRHRLAVFNRAVLDARFQVQDPTLKEFVQQFEAALHHSAGTGTPAMAALALQFVARTRLQSDQKAAVYFDATVLDWRDDNRHLWTFIEDGDEEDTRADTRQRAAQEPHHLAARLHPEWDYHLQAERPDWVKVYEYLHPSGNPALVDQLLASHSPLMRRLQKVLDAMKPQGRERLRRLEYGSELDADLAQQAWIDFRTGHTPDPRIQEHWRCNERNVSVQLIMDLSASLADPIGPGNETVLQLSQAAVAMLGWTLHQLGDALAIAGFHSNTRHDVRYMHIKGFGEPWGHEVKARLAALEPAYSTRMGCALRHGTHTLLHRKSARKMLLVLTDGEPSDVDVSDPDYLAQDARQVVQQLQAQGVFVWCIQLHPAHESSVRTVFGEHYTLVSRIHALPQTLAELFVRLTR